MKIIKLGMSILALGLSFGAGSALAQGCCTPPPPTSCNDLLPSCPVDRDPNLTQTQAGAISSTITINGSVITITPAPTDGSPVDVSASDISSTSTAIGNNISGKSTNSVLLDIVSTQDLSANVSATNTITTAAAVPGVIAQVTTAYGNTSQAEACCGGMDIIADQNVSLAAGSIDANATLTTAPGLGVLTMTTSAIANVMGAEGVNGDVSLVTNQSNAAGLNSNSNAAICCNTTSSSVSSTATANSSQSSSESSTVFSWAVQNNSGAVYSNATTNIDAGVALSTAAQSTGNIAANYNKWGYTQLYSAQTTSGIISSYANTNANYYDTSSTVGTTSQGNLAILSTMGSDGRIYATQEVSFGGDIFAQSDWTGASQGGVGTAIASASGNGITAFACTVCGLPGAAIYGDVTQTNSGNITSSVNMSGGSGSAMSASAMAVGNSANFITQSSSN